MTRSILVIVTFVVLAWLAGSNGDEIGGPSIHKVVVKPITSLLGGNVNPLGVVTPVYRCGGVGTFIQLRISDCNAGLCNMLPGSRYDCEKDFIPSSVAPSLSLRVQICTSVGFCHGILDVVLPGSSVQPGVAYTARFSIVPNDILSGQTLQFRAVLYHTDNGLEETCTEAYVYIE